MPLRPPETWLVRRILYIILCSPPFRVVGTHGTGHCSISAYIQLYNVVWCVKWNLRKIKIRKPNSLEERNELRVFYGQCDTAVTLYSAVICNGCGIHILTKYCEILVIGRKIKPKISWKYTRVFRVKFFVRAYFFSAIYFNTPCLWHIFCIRFLNVSVDIRSITYLTELFSCIILLVIRIFSNSVELNPVKKWNITHY